MTACLLVPTLAGGQAPNFQPSTLLNSNATTGIGSDYDPRICTDDLGNWIVAWDSDDDHAGAGTDSDIFMSRSTDSGLTWSPLTFLNSTAGSDIGIDRRVRIATDKSGNWVAVWTSNEALSGSGSDDDIFIARSTDNGGTWTAPALLNSAATGDTLVDLDPQVATDGTGNWVTVWRAGLSGMEDDIYVARSSDNGLTWTPQQLMHASFSSDATSEFAHEISVDDSGNWVVAWTSHDYPSFSEQDVFVSRSTDNGSTWGSPILLDASGDTSTVPSIGSTSLGRWAAVWVNAGFDIVVSRSNDGGENWLTPEVLTTSTYIPAPHTQVATDSSGNCVIVLAEPELHFFNSADHGVNWTAMGLLDPRSPTGASQANARVITDGNDNWISVWSSGEDYLGSGTDADIFVSTTSSLPPSVGIGGAWFTSLLTLSLGAVALVTIRQYRC